MNSLRRTYRLRLLRAAFLLAGILLFAAHLTFRFYQYASVSFVETAKPRVLITSWNRTGAKHLHHRDAAMIRLDRRYDFVPVFGLVSPEFTVGNYPTGIGICRPSGQHDRSLLAIANVYLRGPPAPSFS